LLVVAAEAEAAEMLTLQKAVVPAAAAVVLVRYLIQLLFQ
jgi:hypothetical protein